MKRFTDLDGAILSEKFINLLRNVISKSRNKLVEARSFIPDFKMKITYFRNRGFDVFTRYFTCINRKKHGKNRIYASFRDEHRSYFMFYISAKTIKKLCSIYDNYEDEVKNALVNRWVITEDAYKFKCMRQLLYHMIAIEISPKKKNHPQLGSSSMTWMINDKFIDTYIHGTRSIICSGRVHSIELSNFSLDEEVFHGVSS